MAITAATSVSNSSLVTESTQMSKLGGGDHNRAFAKSPRHINFQGSFHDGDQLGRRRRRQSSGHSFLKFSKTTLWHVCGKPRISFFSRLPTIICRQNTTEKQECTRSYSDSNPDSKRAQDSDVFRLEDACQFIYNDAKFVNERARSDIFLLSRSIMSMDERARQDVAIIGSGFLKLDARARKDTEKIDTNVKRKAEFLHHIAMILKEKAESRLKKAADKHWSDGALEADLRRADFFAKQRALEDALTALEFVKNIHDMMVTEMYKLKRDSSSSSSESIQGHITIEKNGKTHDFFPGEVSSDRISAIQEAYLSMASAFYEADGIDYTDPEELELLVATLIDLDAMDGKSSVSLLAECSSSPDVNTRKALANALATAPSMWTLGNAGMGALQVCAEIS
ncbi:senescence-associated protein SPA15, chloroplastic isoform X2 [Impatiens glandulifera]|uniref:senescence-associated protein SPA15, chloroplastic isoform X2 n=1 Tax=Impatiens glandulifera TaxID=253017 RepID=UPI001FB11A28|nr:senescence-associated protein SPA15, chloroplastic isoform X2 [Impatiens glandulifera]